MTLGRDPKSTPAFGAFRRKKNDCKTVRIFAIVLRTRAVFGKRKVWSEYKKTEGEHATIHAFGASLLASCDLENKTDIFCSLKKTTPGFAIQHGERYCESPVTPPPPPTAPPPFTNPESNHPAKNYKRNGTFVSAT